MNPDLLEQKQKTEATLKSIKNLPLIPKVVFNVTKLLNDQAVSTTALTNEIGKDQGLTAKVLSISNSPLYGLQRKVTSLEFAIIVLGSKEISDIVTAISLADVMKFTNDKYFNQDEFLAHSLLVGTASKNICQTLGYFDIGSDAFVAGVLHDIGIQILYKFFNTQFKLVVNLVKEKKIKFALAEKEIFGLTHQEVGKFLGDKWNLPGSLVDVLNYHHNPGISNNNKAIPAIVHLADFMTQKFQIGGFYWDEGIELDESVIEILKFEKMDGLESFIKNYQDLYYQSAAASRY
ncbi:MAG: HDOD domain-containing protein [Ignavibacteriales bacterium]|nr:HDOD domain-containing protein [Ignavibacteriales bacterium]